MNHEQIVSQRLKPKEVPDLRKRLLAAQRGICPICGKSILPKDAVLDHDHETGRCRQVLHRQCNSAEGRILYWLRRSGVTDPLNFIRNLANYWEADYIDNAIHPSHRSREEKEIAALKKQMKRMKSDVGRTRYAMRIQEVYEAIDEARRLEKDP